MRNLICLGIECTAHTFGAALVDSKGKILEEKRDMYTSEHGGIIPWDAAKHHEKIGKEMTFEVLHGKKPDFVAFSQSPGMAPCLVAGMKVAKQVANELNVPLIGVNHIAAHLEIGRLLTKAKDPIFVFTSGANTQIIAHEDKYRIFGETLDVGIGNALDKFGREIGLGFPAGPKIEELAKKGKYIELPYTVKGMDVDFSGIITKCINLYKQGVSKEDLCYSLQETVFAMLAEITERALAHCDKKEVLLIGGVAANKRFCEMLDKMCKARKAKFYATPLKYCGDQAAQIGWLGILSYPYVKQEKLSHIDIDPYLRVDQIETPWFI